jgi:tetratricopeptide (TPR) repeat protein
MLAASALPDSTVARTVDQYALAQDAYRLGDYPEARRYLDDYLRSHPDDARGWFQHGAVSLKLKQYSVAVIDFSAADRLKPDGLTRACLAYACNENRQPQIARTYFQQAIQAGYDRAEVFNDLGFVDLREGALADAEHNLTQAIQRDRGLQASYHNRGRVYLRRAQQPTARATNGGTQAANGLDANLLQRALSDLKQALDIGPPSGELYHDLAVVCAHLSAKDRARTTEAIEHLANGLRHGLDPGALRYKLFVRTLGPDPAFTPLSAQPAIAHPRTLAQRFLPILPE